MAKKRPVKKATKKASKKKVTKKSGKKKSARKKGNGKTLERSEWVAAALDQVETQAIRDLKIDLLCSQLQVTKGSFYWHFEHRDELLDAILEQWVESSTDRFVDLLDNLEGTPWERIQQLIHSGTERRILIVDQVFREWGRVDDRVRDMVRKIDRRRSKLLTDLIRDLGYDEEGAKLRAELFYGWALSRVYFFGDELEKTPKARANRALKVLSILTEDRKKK